MSGRRLVFWSLSPVAIATVLAVLLAALTVGIHIPGLGLLQPFPGGKSFDYSSTPYRGFSPLEDRFVKDALGEATPAGVLRMARAGGRRSVPPDPRPPHPSVPPLSNDNFQHAAPVRGLPYAAETDTSGATREAGEPAGCGSIRGGTVWFRYKAVRELPLIASTTGSSYGTSLAVYRGSTLRNLKRLGCDEDANGLSLVPFTTHAATDYYFQVEALLVSGGRLAFRIDRQGTTSLASVSGSGEQANDINTQPDISGDGRVVTFTSYASNLSDGFRTDCRVSFYNCSNVFARDRITGETDLVSIGIDGKAGNDLSEYSSVSSDGRYVAFQSMASNLVEGDDNLCATRTRSAAASANAEAGCYDVFVRDRLEGTTTLVSVAPDGEVGNSDSLAPSISADGRYVTFESVATNLVRGDTQVCQSSLSVVSSSPETYAGTCRDIFVRDLVQGKTTLISVPSLEDQDKLGSQANAASGAPSISADGRVVAFASYASNLVRRAVPRCTGASANYPFYPYRECVQVYVHDRVAHKTEIVSISSAGAVADGQSGQTQPRYVSGDGRYVAFLSEASNLAAGDTGEGIDVFVRDRVARTTTLVSTSFTSEEFNNGFANVAISSNGRYVAFSAITPNLVTGDTGVCPNQYTISPPEGLIPCREIFIYDQLTATTARISVSSSGEAANGSSDWASLSADGRWAAFFSEATNLVDGDRNECTTGSLRDRLDRDRLPLGTCADVFIHERLWAAG